MCKNTCIVCGGKATCFYYHNDGYVPYCIDCYKEINFPINNNMIDEKVVDFIIRRK